NVAEIESFNVVKGFLNLKFSDISWLKQIISADNFIPKTNETLMVKYSSPNTNKSLHLGHLRNNFLVISVSEILMASGKNVVKPQIMNGRGIQICKSMLAWHKWGNGEEPSDTLKGDKLVGKYYVLFDKHYKEEIAALENKGIDKNEAEKKAPLIIEAQKMLK